MMLSVIEKVGIAFSANISNEITSDKIDMMNISHFLKKDKDFSVSSKSIEARGMGRLLVGSFEDIIINYVRYVKERLQLEDNWLIVSLILFERVLLRKRLESKMVLEFHKAIPLILVCIIVSSKLMEDVAIYVDDFVEQLHLLNLNKYSLLKLEADVIQNFLNFNVFVKEETFKTYVHTLNHSLAEVRR